MHFLTYKYTSFEATLGWNCRQTNERLCVCT